MYDGRIPKDIVYGEVAMGHYPVGCPTLWFQDICKGDLNLTGIDPDSWEQLADNHNNWWHAVQGGAMEGEKNQNQ